MTSPPPEVRLQRLLDEAPMSLEQWLVALMNLGLRPELNGKIGPNPWMATLNYNMLRHEGKGKDPNDALQRAMAEFMEHVNKGKVTEKPDDISLSEHLNRQQQIQNSLTGKTIERVDASSINVITLYFSDGTRTYLEVESVAPGLYGIVLGT